MLELKINTGTFDHVYSVTPTTFDNTSPCQRSRTTRIHWFDSNFVPRAKVRAWVRGWFDSYYINEQQIAFPFWKLFHLIVNPCGKFVLSYLFIFMLTCWNNYSPDVNIIIVTCKVLQLYIIQALHRVFQKMQ
jgi:hypothetical protein